MMYIDFLMRMLAWLNKKLARNINETPLTKEQAEDLTRRAT